MKIIPPMRKVFKRLGDTSDMYVLELFAGDGSSHVKHYIKKVRGVRLLEINPTKCKYDVIQADAYDYIGESYPYDIVISDNPIGKHQDHYEHFDLFPQIFKVVGRYLILNVVPKPSQKLKRHYPNLFNDQHMAKRTEFYRTNSIDIPIHKMVEIYNDHANRKGKHIVNYFSVQRSIVHYLVLEVKSTILEQLKEEK